LQGFVTTSTKKQKTGPSRTEEIAENMLHTYIFQFVNNNGLPDTTATNPDLRKIIDFAKDNASALKNYRPLGKRKFVSIRLATYNYFVADVTALVKRVRQWYIDNTVSLANRIPFICIKCIAYQYFYLSLIIAKGLSQEFITVALMSGMGSVRRYWVSPSSSLIPRYSRLTLFQLH
jgi:hypothetical protein